MQHQSSTKIEATVFDPTPPSGFFAALGPSLLVASVVIAYVSVWPTTLLAIGLALVLANEMRPRRRPKTAHIVCKAGSIRVPGRGLIRARDLLGATTARFADRVTLVVAHRRRPRTPIVIDVADEAALSTICKSLGIGHNGFGYVDFVARPTDVERARYPVAAAALAALAMTRVSDSAALVFGLAVPVILLVAAVLALVRLSSAPPIVRITSGGVFVPLHGSTFVPFHAIDDVVLRAKELVLRVRTEDETVVHVLPVSTASWARQSCSRAELEHLVAQIRGAVERAHGTFVFKSEPALAKQLERGESEAEADWLARIDTIGLGAAGYRATVFDAAELWTLLEDPEATGDVRAAAARILARLDRTTLRVRVADVLATVRDDETRTRIADSIEEAIEEPEERSARPLLE